MDGTQLSRDPEIDAVMKCCHNVGFVFQVVVENLVDRLSRKAVLHTASGDSICPQVAQLLDLPTDALEKWRDDLEQLCHDAGMNLGAPSSAVFCSKPVLSCSAHPMCLASNSGRL